MTQSFSPLFIWWPKVHLWHVLSKGSDYFPMHWYKKRKEMEVNFSNMFYVWCTYLELYILVWCTIIGTRNLLTKNMKGSEYLASVFSCSCDNSGSQRGIEEHYGPPPLHTHTFFPLLDINLCIRYKIYKMKKKQCKQFWYRFR